MGLGGRAADMCGKGNMSPEPFPTNNTTANVYQIPHLKLYSESYTSLQSWLH